MTHYRARHGRYRTDHILIYCAFEKRYMFDLDQRGRSAVTPWALQRLLSRPAHYWAIPQRRYQIPLALGR
jgi:hypothetical protein